MADAGHAAPPPPRKGLGQHFLTDRHALDRIVQALAPQAGETIVEIGPGRGALTDRLAVVGCDVVAVEVDRLLVPFLRARYASAPHVRIVEGDVLATELRALAPAPWVLVGNVPYYITTPILFEALRAPRPARMVFLVQREVAERIVAPAGSDPYGALSVNVQALARAELVARVPAGAFHPRPKVDSAVLRLVPLDAPVVAAHEEGAFSRLVVAAFGQRRKQMRRVVREVAGLGVPAAEAALATAGIDPQARPETLPPEAFARLLRAVAASGPVAPDPVAP